MLINSAFVKCSTTVCALYMPCALPVRVAGRSARRERLLEAVCLPLVLDRIATHEFWFFASFAAVLGVSGLLEGYSLWVASRYVLAGARARGMPVLQYIKCVRQYIGCLGGPGSTSGV